jgi:hypothetical protein
MKRHLIIVMMILSIIGVSCGAEASLIRTPVDDTFVVVDDVNNLMWADLNRFSSMTYDQVLQEINDMNDADFGGSDTWQLASIEMVSDMFNDDNKSSWPFNSMGFVSTGEIHQDVYLIDVGYWGITCDSMSPGTHEAYVVIVEMWDSPYLIDVISIYSQTMHYVPNGTPNNGAWVVSTTSTQMPEPATMFLFVTALIGLAGFRKKLT